MKMTARSVARNLKILIAVDAVTVALLWLVWSPLLIVWHLDYASTVTMVLVVAGLLTRGLRKRLGPEIASDPITFRRLHYAVVKWLSFGVVGGQIGVAIEVRTVFVSVISSILIVIAGALLLHEWTALREVEQNGPNQSSEPTRLLVTIRACARLAPSNRVAHL